jgi:beta-lactamase superfamily II metal-dependent hydrolase
LKEYCDLPKDNDLKSLALSKKTIDITLNLINALSLTNIKFLKAGSGDCILIHHARKNILIDGGNEPTFLFQQLGELNEEEQSIDYLIITHHDDDHIAGIIALFNAINEGLFPKDFIKKVYFNGPRIIRSDKQVSDQSLSYKQASSLEKLLIKSGILGETANEGTKAIEFDGLKLSFLSPTDSDLKIYSEAKGAYLTGDFKCDWDVSMNSLDRFIDDSSLDDSLPNKTSIVSLLEVDGKKILLPGDCTPKRLYDVIVKLVDPETGLLSLDYLKLPHHCSYRSLSEKLLCLVDCKKFIISTNSKKHFLPNKRGILKLCKFLGNKGSEIEFLFNYEDALNALKITNPERKKYKISLTPNNKRYGIDI